MWATDIQSEKMYWLKGGARAWVTVVLTVQTVVYGVHTSTTFCLTFDHVEFSSFWQLKNLKLFVDVFIDSNQQAHTIFETKQMQLLLRGPLRLHHGFSCSKYLCFIFSCWIYIISFEWLQNKALPIIKKIIWVKQWQGN